MFSGKRIGLFVSICTACWISVASPDRARAQEGPNRPWIGERGITETVAEIMAREANAPPVPIDEGPSETRRHTLPDRSRLPQDPASPDVSQWPLAGPLVQTLQPFVPPPPQPNSPQTVATSFKGVAISESGFIPPDSQGAVGPTQVLFVENGRIKVFSRTGTLGGLNASTNTFFTSVRNGSGTSDPQVKYDRLSGRWFVTMVNVASANNRILLAVSSGSTITSTSSFTFFFFTQATGGGGNTALFADYPKTGIDANAIYIGCNMFSSNLVATRAWVIRKSSVTSGGPIMVTAFNMVTSATGPGPVAPIGVDNDDPASTEGYIIGESNNTAGRLVMRRISSPGGSPSISGDLNITVPTTAAPVLQPAQGSTHTLDPVDQFCFDAMMHRNRATGVATLWTAQNLGVNSSGVSSGTINRNGARWYEIGSLTSTPALVQAGTLFDSASSNPRGFTIPSCAMSGQGHMALGCTIAGSTEHAEIGVSGRLAGDALGTQQAVTVAVTSSTTYNVQGSTPQRWGDFSCTVVDPNDDQTMWTFQEYCDATDSWGVRVVQLLAPPPATPASCSPASVAQGQSNVDVVVTGTSSSGSGFYDTDPSFNRIAASASGSGVTVNTITFTDPTHITLNVSVAPGATVGSRTITVTNPDGQSTTSASGILTINPSGGGSSVTPICFGDGSGTPCPCGNNSPVGDNSGCLHSLGQGGKLTSSGTPSISSDTFVLQGSQMPPSTALYFQGTTTTNGGAGATFGDGLRCAGGTVIRLGEKVNVAGGSSYPEILDPAISVMGADSVGDTRTYQVWYRNADPLFCQPETFNLTNALLVVWGS